MMTQHSFVNVMVGLVVATQLGGTNLLAGPGPNDGKPFHGRIAYSADGNHNDPDDWAASPVALAIMAQAGWNDRLVHFDYNCILTDNNPQWAKTHADSVLGAVKHYRFDPLLFHNCQTDRSKAIASIARAINASSADDPLYFIVAGPMEVPYLGIQQSQRDKRQFVYCISHSRWNDGFAQDYTFTHTKRSVIGAGVKWIQIPDQNPTLAFGKYGKPAMPEQFEPFFWMRDSADRRLRFLWDRMIISTRPDCSDAGMVWFLVTGDQVCEVPELRRLLEAGEMPVMTDPRPHIRLEAESFLEFDGYQLDDRHDREASHRTNVRLSDARKGAIRTPFLEPYTTNSGNYDIDVRYLDEPGKPFSLTLLVNGKPQGERFNASGTDGIWVTRTIHDVQVNAGDQISVQVHAAAGSHARLDFVQLNLLKRPSAENDHLAKLDDPDALPGQIIVAGKHPGYLKYNGGGPAFLCGPDNPEDFLFRGTLNPDGTRSGGQQEEMIQRLAAAGVNAFHCQMFRMQRCNFKNEGDDTHCPFVDHDPTQPLNENVLDQWNRWLDLFEKHHINVHLEFYNDATNVELMGWKLDADGNLPADERRWITGVVRRFKHHKNVLWGIEESCNKLSRAHTPHFRKLAQVIADTDNHHHPIVQSFVVPNDPEGDFPPDGLTPDDYVGDPHIRVVTWLHVPPHGNDIEKQHAEYLSYLKRDAAKFVVMKNETYHHPKKGPRSRKYMWSCAMTGMHCLEAYHHADDSPLEILREDGFINRFMEQTSFHQMKPHDELAAESSKWVLASPGHSYIAYTYQYSESMGVKAVTAGRYQLTWLDTESGKVVRQKVSVQGGDASWHKPDHFGNEIALSITPVDDR